MSETQLVVEPPQVEVDPRKIVIKKLDGKWNFKFVGLVKMRDIVHLKRAMVIEFRRTKVRARLDKQKAERKEQVNG